LPMRDTVKRFFIAVETSVYSVTANVYDSAVSNEKRDAHSGVMRPVATCTLTCTSTRASTRTSTRTGPMDGRIATA
jgi:hypothetical protein